MTTSASMRNIVPELVLNPMKKIHVVAGVIYNSDKSAVFLAKRAANQDQGDLWEFPGGKVESDETPVEALVRELNEEIGISITVYNPLLKVSHDYPDKSIVLEVWSVENFNGQPVGRENQLVAWVNLDDLRNYAFPEANRAIIDRLCR